MNKKLLLIIIYFTLLGCNNSQDSSVTDEQINQYKNDINNNVQLLQDLNNKISINIISGFEILDNENNPKLILKAFNKSKDISLSVFDLGKINNKSDYFNKLKNILKSKNIDFNEKNNSIIYKFNHSKTNIKEICFTIFSQENNLYSICLNSKLLSFDDLEKSIEKIKFK